MTHGVKTGSKKDQASRPKRLPIGAEVNPILQNRFEELASGLPDSIGELYESMRKSEGINDYDAARPMAIQGILQRLHTFSSASDLQKSQLLDCAKLLMTSEERAPVYRMLSKDRAPQLRRRVKTQLHKHPPQEVALPLKGSDVWDQQGWMYGVMPGKAFQHEHGTRVQKKRGVPPIKNVEELRKILKIGSLGQLRYLLLASSEGDEGPYRTFHIPKRDGSQREICAPTMQLKRVQRNILWHILSEVPTHDAAHGFVPGRSIVTNAAQHQGREYLIKFDLKDFFPTFHIYRVMGLFSQLGYDMDEGFFRAEDSNRAIAPMLARLTTYGEDPQTWQKRFLPQGAPTSPMIANLICRGLDARLDGLAQKLGGTYTRYADDLTFSFDDKPDSGIGRFRWWVDQICHQEGFVLRRDKFRVIRPSQRQMVTGLVVNEKDALRIPRKQRRQFRAIIHNCLRDGIEAQMKGNPRFPAYLQGFAAFINMVHPNEGAEYIEIVKDLLKVYHSGQEDETIEP